MNLTETEHIAHNNELQLASQLGLKLKWAALLLLMLTALPTGAQVRNLRVEGQQSPLGIDNTTPRFSWQNNLTHTGQRQNTIHDLVKYTLSCLTYGGYMVDCPHLERMAMAATGTPPSSPNGP